MECTLIQWRLSIYPSEDTGSCGTFFTKSPVSDRFINPIKPVATAAHCLGGSRPPVTWPAQPVIIFYLDNQIWVIPRPILYIILLLIRGGISFSMYSRLTFHSSAVEGESRKTAVPSYVELYRNGYFLIYFLVN